jgi:hypothetical protein
MSATPLRITGIRHAFRELFEPRRPQFPRPETPAPRDAAPVRQVPVPRYEALAIGLGCDQLGRHSARRHR